MMRLIEKIVFSGFVTAWRLAVSPTKISPLSVKATTLGVVFLPSLFGITLLSPLSYTLTHEFVVPRSIPITFDIVFSLKILFEFFIYFNCISIFCCWFCIELLVYAVFYEIS